MPYENMTQAEFERVVADLGFKRNEADKRDKGYESLAAFLRCDRDRFQKFPRTKKGVPPELAMLLRLMAATGFTPERVEALPPYERAYTSTE